MAASASNQPSNFLWTFTTLHIENRVMFSVLPPPTSLVCHILCLFFCFHLFSLFKDREWMLQNFGYVDRHFAVAYADELSDKWMLVDSNRQLHKLRYNQDPRSPRLTKGWTKLRTAFNIQGKRTCAT